LHDVVDVKVEAGAAVSVVPMVSGLTAMGTPVLMVVGDNVLVAVVDV
jgi:hypothetical protein